MKHVIMFRVYMILRARCSSAVNSRYEKKQIFKFHLLENEPFRTSKFYFIFSTFFHVESPSRRLYHDSWSTLYIHDVDLWLDCGFPRS